MTCSSLGWVLALSTVRSADLKAVINQTALGGVGSRSGVSVSFLYRVEKQFGRNWYDGIMVNVYLGL